MVIGYGIIKKRDVVDVLQYTFTGNNIPEGTLWVKKIEKWNNVSTAMSVKLDVYEFIYHNIPLKDVIKVDIFNIIYSEPQKSENIVTIS